MFSFHLPEVAPDLLGLGDSFWVLLDTTPLIGFSFLGLCGSELLLSISTSACDRAEKVTRHNSTDAVHNPALLQNIGMQVRVKAV